MGFNLWVPNFFQNAGIVLKVSAEIVGTHTVFRMKKVCHL